MFERSKSDPTNSIMSYDDSSIISKLIADGRTFPPLWAGSLESVRQQTWKLKKLIYMCRKHSATEQNKCISKIAWAGSGPVLVN